MKRFCFLSISLFACLFLASATPALTQTGASSFTTVDVSGAGTGALQGTYIVGIDTAGDVAGSYIDSLGAYHGFVRTVNGSTVTVETINATGAGTGAGQGTFVTSISPNGNIAGFTIGSTGNRSGFARATDGTMSTVVGANGSEIMDVLGINSAGFATGADHWGNGGTGFVWNPDGTSTNFSTPVEGNMGIAINTAGVIAGRYMNYSPYVSHGFVRSADGTTTTDFDPPSLATAQTTNGNDGTLPASINTAGVIAGTYTDSNRERHSFVRTADGTTITPFDPAGTDTNSCASSGKGILLCGSAAVGINDAGDIVGVYFDADAVAHGYLRSGATSQFTSFDVPGAGTGAFQGTAGFAVSSSGIVAGTYVDANNVLHGFIHTLGLDTSTALTPSQSSTVFGQPATFTATVSSASGTPPNGESILFMNGTTQLGSETLAGGTASFTTTTLPVGSDSVTAVYSGDSTLAGSSSTAVSQAVSKASTTTTLTSSPNPSWVGQIVGSEAIVSGQFGGLPTGSVVFNVGTTTVVTAGLSNTSATIATSTLPLGTTSITAVYSGDSNFTDSTSNTVSQVVSASSAPDFTLTINPASISVQAGNSGKTTVTVQDEAGFNSNVLFACSGLPARATCTFTLLTVPTPAGISYSTLTVTTTAATAFLHRNSSPLLPGSALAIVLCCFGARKRRRLQMLLLLAVSLAGLSLFTGCGGSSSVGGSKSVTSTVTVTAASGTLSHSTAFSLTVN